MPDILRKQTDPRVLAEMLRESAEDLLRLAEIAGIEAPFDLRPRSAVKEEAGPAPRSEFLRKSPLILGTVLQVWYREGVYLQADGTPKPLPLEGRCSVTSVLRDARIDEDARDIVSAMLTENLLTVDRSQRFTPTTRFVRGSLTARTPSTVRGVWAALRTAIRNLQQPTTKTRWYHRAVIAAVPARRLPELDSFLRQQGDHLAVMIDDWCAQEERSAAASEEMVTVDVNVWFTPSPEKLSDAPPASANDGKPTEHAGHVHYLHSSRPR